MTTKPKKNVAEETAQKIFERTMELFNEGKPGTPGEEDQCHLEGNPNLAAVVMVVNSETLQLIKRLGAYHDCSPTMIVHKAIVDYVRQNRRIIEQQRIYGWMLH